MRKSAEENNHSFRRFREQLLYYQKRNSR